jgi:hypothetical protein
VIHTSAVDPRKPKAEPAPPQDPPPKQAQYRDTKGFHILRVELETTNDSGDILDVAWGGEDNAGRTMLQLNRHPMVQDALMALSARIAAALVKEVESF